MIAAMPCYFFTLHAYRSWMPDQRRGYVRRGAGVQAANSEAAASYAQRARQEPAVFTEEVQHVILAGLMEGCTCQGYRLHAVFFEPTHVHFLVSWRLMRGWLRVRMGLKQSATRTLSRHFGQRAWFSAGGSRRQVRQREHFNHLVTAYRAKHRGLKWVEGQAT